MAARAQTSPAVRELVAGLTEEERAELLLELAERPADTGPPRDPTPRERLIADLLKDRDHLEGCPVLDGTSPAGLVEAYEQISPAPPPGLRALGVGPGDVVVVARCLKCAGVHHYASPAPAGTRYGEGLHVRALLTQRLAPAVAAELDGTL
jgi:hypothetical protein